MSKFNLALHTLALGSLLLPLVNCGGSPHEPTEAYFLVSANTKIAYWQAAAAGLDQAARPMGVKWELTGPDTYDPQAEKQAFQKVVQQGKPSGILVSAADPGVMRDAIDGAIARGIPVITMDSDAPASKRLLFIGTNNHQAGRMGGGVAGKALGGKGSVVIFTMPEQANLKERLTGYQEAFRAYPGIRIAEIVDIKGDPRIAFDKTMDLVAKKTPVDGFICLEALACPEVAEVLNRNNVKGKIVVAMDTDQRTLEWIEKGLIEATIAQKPFTMAYFGVQVLDDLHHHRPASLSVNWAEDTRSPLPAFVDTGATMIDKSNVAAFLRSNAPAKPS